MRKLLLVTLLMVMVPATNANAQADEGVLTNHLASVSSDEVWENGSEGSVFVRAGYPSDDLTLHLFWFGILYDDAGNVLLHSQDYDIHWEEDPTLLTEVETFQLRGLKKARFRWVHPTACMIYPDCDHTVVIDVRWQGVGPVTTDDRRDPITGEGYVSYSRAARVRGEFTVDGMTVPGGDLDLGEGVLSQERCFGPEGRC